MKCEELREDLSNAYTSHKRICDTLSHQIINPDSIYKDSARPERSYNQNITNWKIFVYDNIGSIIGCAVEDATSQGVKLNIPELPLVI